LFLAIFPPARNHTVGSYSNQEKQEGRLIAEPRGDATAMKTKPAGQADSSNEKQDAQARGEPAGPSRSNSGGASSRGIDTAYLALIRRFPLRPIRTEDELDAASAIIDELTDRDDLSPSEADFLDVLGDLVEKYEDEHVEMPPVSDAEMLRSLMDEKGVSQADVVRGAGISKTVLSLVLNGKRDLTREHIEAQSMYFGVSPAAFLDPA
jgi:HTH-type transcriptional regulator/antitoxin HigA